MIAKKYLILPVDLGKSPSRVTIEGEDSRWDYLVQLSEERVDAWTYIRLPKSLTGKSFRVYTEQKSTFLSAAEVRDELKAVPLTGLRFCFPHGKIVKIENIYRAGGLYCIEFQYVPTGCLEVFQCGYALTCDWVHWEYCDEPPQEEAEPVFFTAFSGSGCVHGRHGAAGGSGWDASVCSQNLSQEDQILVTVRDEKDMEYLFIAGDGFSLPFTSCPATRSAMHTKCCKTAFWRCDPRDFRKNMRKHLSGQRRANSNGFSPVFSLCPVKGLEDLRVWKREWEGEELNLPFSVPLRFRVLPGRWPDIRILEAEGTGGDIGGRIFEFYVEMDMGAESFAGFCFGQWKLTWAHGRLKYGDYEMPLAEGKQSLALRIWAESEWIVLLGEERLFYMCGRQQEQQEEKFSNDITENLTFRLEREQESRFEIYAGKTAHIKYAAAWGLGSPFLSEEEKQAAAGLARGDKIYGSSRGYAGRSSGVQYHLGRQYTIYENCVADESYGGPPAWVKKDGSIYSPIRVTEEFSWRKNIWGDMTRVVRRTRQWHPSFERDAYPSVKTGIPVLDSACLLAFDTFYRCVQDTYALEGQEGMWNAGLFQGEGEGFGVWLRDTAHTALRMGNLVDRMHARRSLLYTAEKGIDNGSDGPAMAQVGIWDYYLATGDRQILYEAWPWLLKKTEDADSRYDSSRNLVRASNSTSNDAFPEPENGGYSLSTEVYFQQAYEAMGKIGRMIGWREETVRLWEEKAFLMKEAIRTQYWNEEYGYYTSGPKGSEAYRRGFWETSGQEAVLWPRFGIAGKEQRRRILQKLPETALNEYGICLFPYREERNHLCHSIWYVWHAGFALAASAEKNRQLLELLLWQQVRSCILNKEFYEVVDFDTGRAWRWPGQLWHAAGFLSVVLGGAVGISYTEEGLTFSPCLPESLNELKISNLLFRDAVFDIRIQGGGLENSLSLDGTVCTKIPLDLTGRHDIEITVHSPA